VINDPFAEPLVLDGRHVRRPGFDAYFADATSARVRQVVIVASGDDSQGSPPASIGFVRATRR
jgi:hypothetical protein